MCQAALRAGYLIVPNFDVELIAVRVDREIPSEGVGDKFATPQVLAPGTGRYVDNALKGYTETKRWKNESGDHSQKIFYPTAYREHLDFPAMLVKPTSPWTLRRNPRCVTFFIAWWLDTRDL